MKRRERREEKKERKGKERKGKERKFKRVIPVTIYKFANFDLTSLNAINMK